MKCRTFWDQIYIYAKSFVSSKSLSSLFSPSPMRYFTASSFLSVSIFQAPIYTLHERCYMQARISHWYCTTFVKKIVTEDDSSTSHPIYIQPFSDNHNSHLLVNFTYIWHLRDVVEISTTNIFIDMLLLRFFFICPIAGKKLLRYWYKKKLLRDLRKKYSGELVSLSYLVIIFITFIQHRWRNERVELWKSCVRFYNVF